MTTDPNPSADRRVRQAVDQTMLDALGPGSLIVGLIYAALVPIYALRPPRDGSSLLIAAACGTAVVLVVLGLRWRIRLPAPQHAQKLGALVLGAVLANNTLFLALFPEPQFAGTLCAVLLAAGWFFLTRPWFTLFLIGTASAFVFTIFRGSAEANWFGPLMLLVATGGLAAVVRTSRGRTLRRLELLRIENEERTREQQRAEGMLRRTQKLESLAAMAGGIAHDFNNLLTVIVGNASLVLTNIAPGDEAVNNLQDVIDAGSRATRLTDQLLAYTGRGLQKIETTDLSAQVSRMQALLSSSVPSRVHLRLDLAENLPVVAVDPEQLQQVLVNLILNAGQALEDQGDNICIRTGVADLSESDVNELEPAARQEPGRYVYIEVDDDGCGMEEHVLERIFDPFFTTRHNGRGLGLAAVLGIVRAHGGGLRVLSKPAAGTCVRVFFPASRHAPHHPKLDERSQPFEVAGGTALVIDDEPLVRRIAATVLSKLGWEVIEAESGRDGIEALRGSGRDIRFCLLDMNMPGLGGEETLQGLREIRPELPVMLTSGYSEESVARLLEIGRTVFLEKPYRPARLSNVLQELLDSDPRVAPSAADERRFDATTTEDPR